MVLSEMEDIGAMAHAIKDAIKDLQDNFEGGYSIGFNVMFTIVKDHKQVAIIVVDPTEENEPEIKLSN